MPRKPSHEEFPQQVLDSVAVLDRLADAMTAESGPRVFLQDSVPDKYSLAPAPVIDCDNRIPLCHAACCRLNVVLSQQDVQEGIVSWDPRRPYLNAQDSEGYCVHLERPPCHCSIYASRPAPCRIFDCRNDRRIWLDFENRIANPALDKLDWPRNLAGDSNATPSSPAHHDGEQQEEAGTGNSTIIGSHESA